MTFQPTDRVALTIKINARSTDPITGSQNVADSFRLIKRGSLGTVEAIQNPGFLVVKFDCLTTRQEIRADMFRAA